MWFNSNLSAESINLIRLVTKIIELSIASKLLRPSVRY